VLTSHGARAPFASRLAAPIGAAIILSVMSLTPAPAADILTFSLLQGRLMKTVIRVLTPSFASSGDGLLFKVGSSSHPMANNLRALALDGARPAIVHYTNTFQALLFPGQAL